ncbi:MAG: 3-dehydroquinate synthase [Planctomycetaceae bacterium]|nr:3-dehydroquinate synthase [Planctomycetaceae bacterium]
MSSNPDKINVDFDVPFTHRLRFTDDLFGADSDVLAELLETSDDKPARIQFWLDQNVADSQPQLISLVKRFADSRPDHVQRIGQIQLVPGGEEVKNDIHLLEQILKVFNVSDLDRRSYIVAIGGGAVLDAVGFATSIAHRGLRLVRIPTTTLSQADSGIGVKNSMNLFHKKNWMGSFAVPWAVINDSEMLSTLSNRDFIGGFSEAVKVSLLKDRAMFDQICRSAEAIANREMNVAEPIIRSSAQLHLDHITRGGDPFEMLEARPLDFGHWSAHKMETMSDFSLRHGEAVAIGVAIDTVYSSLEMGLSEKIAEQVLQCLGNLGFHLADPSLTNVEILFDGLEEFRQHLGGRLTLTMLEDVGQPREVHTVNRDKMLKAIEQVAHFADTRKTFQPDN